MALPVRRTVLLGVGNPLRSDDGVGTRIAEDLRAEPVPGIEAIIAETVPENWLGPLRRNPPDLLLLVDAGEMGLPPGSIRRVEEADRSGALGTTHEGLPPDLLDSLLRAGGTRICRVLIQPESLDCRIGLSPSVEAAAERILRALRSEGAAGLLRDLVPLAPEGGYQENRSPR
jgi:hydrogenase 3 maturation protease